MSLPPLLRLASPSEYRRHYITQYCHSSIRTFDGISVRFFPEVFGHAFYRDSSPTAHDKAVFDYDRAARLDWIRAVLQNPAAELYRRTMPNSSVRRIALHGPTRYAVIIQPGKRDPTQARFITAYIVDSNSALAKMRSNPRW